MINSNIENSHHGYPAHINEVDYYKENLYEVLELFRKTINKDFDDWKDADDWLFSNLNLTQKDISDIYKGRSMVYVASCKKGVMLND